MSPRRPDRIGKIVGAGSRFIAGMLMLPPFLMIEGLPYKAALAVFFAFLALLAGKRLRWGYFLILIASVTFFHLLTPWGRVLFEIGPFPITVGALKGGLIRGFTLVGMVFLSVAAVRPELELPGRLGGLLGRTFYYFDSILEGKKRLSRKNFFGSLDALLLERFNPERENLQETVEDAESGLEGNTQPGVLPGPAQGWPIAVLVAMIPWLLWIWTLIFQP